MRRLVLAVLVLALAGCRSPAPEAAPAPPAQPSAVPAESPAAPAGGPTADELSALLDDPLTLQELRFHVEAMLAAADTGTHLVVEVDGLPLALEKSRIQARLELRCLRGEMTRDEAAAELRRLEEASPALVARGRLALAKLRQSLKAAP